MDSRVAQLQHVIFLKDEMILELQTQLAAYETHFGKLDANVLQDAPSSSDTAPLGDSNTVSARSDETSTQQQQRRKSSTAQASAQLLDSAQLEASSASMHYYHNSDSDDDSDSDDSDSLSERGRSSSAPSDATEPPLSASNRTPLRVPSITTAPTAVSTGTGKNVVLDFVEDSPMFRRQLESFEDALSGLRTLLKEVMGRTKDCVVSGQRFGDDERALADELVHRKYARALFTTSCPALESLATVFTDVHATVTTFQTSRTQMLTTIETLVQNAVGRFADHELRDATDLRKDVARLADEYEALLGKLLGKAKPSGSTGTNTGGITDPTNLLGVSTTTSTGNATPNSSSSAVSSSTNVLGSPAVNGMTGISSTDLFNSNTGSTSNSGRSSAVRALERDVGLARLKFELARFDLVRTLNRLDCEKKVVLAECFTSVLFAFLSHFRAGYEAVQRIEPVLQQRQAMLADCRRDFAADDAMWRAQRDELEMRLRVDLDSVGTPTGSTGSNTGNTVSTNGSPNDAARTSAMRSFELPVEVISEDTQSSRALYGTTGNVVKQGYLFVRNSLFPARSWKRRWFQIYGGKLYQNRGKHMDMVLVCDLLLARVRASTASNLPYCFEVIDASQAKSLLQATSERDMLDWIDAARKSTEAMLEKQAHRMTVHPEQQRVIDALVSANSVCADCGLSPAEWVSINLGCVLCIECSGIHRSLGVHVSKVRSLTLDSWEMSLLLLLRDELGNAVVNAVYEHTVTPGWLKPDGAEAAASHDDKVKWIKAKYDYRGFVEPMRDLDATALIDRFIRGAAHSDVRELMWCLAHGVDVNARNAERKTALHAAASVGAAACCDYLILNGASLVLADVHGKLPYDAAKAGGFEAVKLALMQKMSLEQYQF